MKNADIQNGRMLERQDIIDRLQFAVDEIRRSFVEGDEKWNLVSDFIEEEIQIIKSGEYHV